MLSFWCPAVARSNAMDPESQEIRFMPDGDYADFRPEPDVNAADVTTKLTWNYAVAWLRISPVRHQGLWAASGRA